VLIPGFFARGDTAMPVKIGLGAVGLNLALNLVLTQFLSHVGVALATALAAWANALALGLVLARRRQLFLDRRLRRRAPRLLAAAVAMGLVLWGLRVVLFPGGVAPGGAWSFAALALLVAGGALAYFGVARGLGVLDLPQLRAMLRRRRLTRT
jgi:putative peptidoglycan lipid II flippase